MLYATHCSKDFGLRLMLNMYARVIFRYFEGPGIYFRLLCLVLFAFTFVRILVSWLMQNNHAGTLLGRMIQKRS